MSDTEFLESGKYAGRIARRRALATFVIYCLTQISLIIFMLNSSRAVSLREFCMSIGACLPGVERLYQIGAVRPSGWLASTLMCSCGSCYDGRFLSYFVLISKEVAQAPY